MEDEQFTTLALSINYIGSQPINISKDGFLETKVLLYFTKEIDSAEVPLCLTEGQAEQLYKDLEKIFQKIE